MVAVSTGTTASEKDDYTHLTEEDLKTKRMLAMTRTMNTFLSDGAQEWSSPDDEPDAPFTSFSPSEKLTWSSQVPFRVDYQHKLWRIGNKFYDLHPFLDQHPGGRQILEICRDRFEDSTYAFEAYHVNQKKVRAMLSKYQVQVLTHTTPTSHSSSSDEEESEKNNKHLNEGKTGEAKESSSTFPPGFKPDFSHRGPDLCDEKSFYYAIRKRVYDAVKSDPRYEGNLGPTWVCASFFWVAIASYILNFVLLMSPLIDLCAASRTGGAAGQANTHTGHTGHFVLFLILAFVQMFWSGVIGGYGHNWVHQPSYRALATISLDLIGLNSETWFRDHNIQHHMYTNTPYDNHFLGTDPFLVSDPFRPRSRFAKLCAVFQPLILFFGIFGNYAAHTVMMLAPLHTYVLRSRSGKKNTQENTTNTASAIIKKPKKTQEKFTITKFLFPLQIGCYIWNFGLLYGALITGIQFGGLGLWYFTVALMNHNTDQTLDFSKKQQARDWGEEQLLASCDIGVGSGFFSSMRYFWLNYHTVHHLFPSTDMSKHIFIQEIVLETTKEFGIHYDCSPFWKSYFEMCRNFFRRPLQSKKTD